MADQTVIKFDIDGPAAGLSDWGETPKQDIQSGNPVQNGHTYFSTDKDRYYSGVWDCTAHQLVRSPYSVDEFMIVLEGSIIIEDPAGNSATYSAGESFIMPKGLDCSWKQTEYTRKFFVIHDNPGSAEEHDPDKRSIRIDSSADLPAVTAQDKSLYLSAVPEMNLLSLFRDPSGEFEVGLWDCSPMKRVPATIARSEFMHILEGSGSITNADAVVFSFEAGDTFMVPTGMGYQWQNNTYVKKIFCAYTPK
jgi:uncharacterized cupin superfamily protein